jgi:two-component system, LytTR family, sensor kinase
VPGSTVSLPGLTGRGLGIPKGFYLYEMRRQVWILGLVISAGISLITIFSRLLRAEDAELTTLFFSFLYNFLYCFMAWSFYALIFDSNIRFSAGRNKFLIGVCIYIVAAMLIFPYDYFFSLVSNKVQTMEIAKERKSYMLLLRGLLVSGLFYFISNYLYLVSEKQKGRLEIEQLKQAQLAANLSSLKEQLSPHFLFNTLNTLSALTSEKIVKDYVTELGNVYRYVLQYKELDTASLKQELAFIHSYLYIIQTRLERSIDVTIQVDDAFLDSKIPPLTLQLLIENAIKHNVASAARQLRIGVKSSGDNYLVVSNNFQPKTSVQLSAGIGLDNVMQRYKLLLNREIIIEKTTSCFSVKLPLV